MSAGEAARDGWFAEIEGLVSRFRAGEAEIGRRTFAAPRPRARHLDWLRFQVAREARNVEELASHHVCRLAEAVDDTLPREALVERLTEDYQEARHYAMLAYLYEGLGGAPVRWKALREESRTAPWYDTARREHARWDDFRREGRTLELAAALFTRGGGGSLFYGFIGLRGGDYEMLLAEAAKIILRDELEHGASEGRDDLVGLLRARGDVDVACAVIAEMSVIRLEMRNAQFSHVLSDAELKSLAAGGLRPLDAAEMLSACAQTEEHWFERFHRAPKPLSAACLTD
jgi:hypothetical protein